MGKIGVSSIWRIRIIVDRHHTCSTIGCIPAYVHYM